MQYLGHTSPECLETFDRKLNEPAMPPISLELEAEAIGSVISERNMELDQGKMALNYEAMSAQAAARPKNKTREDSVIESNRLQQRK